MNNLPLIYSIASSKPLISRALKIALVVGIILNIINQGEYIFSFNFQEINLIKLCLTFTVPFCVSMYTAVAMQLKFHVGDKSIEDVKLRCKSCNGCIELEKNQTIPFCTICKDKTQWVLSSQKDKKCH